MNLNVAALAATAALLGFHVNEAIKCANDQKTVGCVSAKLSLRPDYAVSRVYGVVLGMFLIIVPLALAYNFKISTISIGILVTCVLAAMQSYVFGCRNYKNKKEVGVCKANLERLLMIASCAGIISVPLHYALT